MNDLKGGYLREMVHIFLLTSDFVDDSMHVTRREFDFLRGSISEANQGAIGFLNRHGVDHVIVDHLGDGKRHAIFTTGKFEKPSLLSEWVDRVVLRKRIQLH